MRCVRWRATRPSSSPPASLPRWVRSATTCRGARPCTSPSSRGRHGARRPPRAVVCAPPACHPCRTCPRDGSPPRRSSMTGWPNSPRCRSANSCWSRRPGQRRRTVPGHPRRARLGKTRGRRLPSRRDHRLSRGPSVRAHRRPGRRADAQARVRRCDRHRHVDHDAVHVRAGACDRVARPDPRPRLHPPRAGRPAGTGALADAAVFRRPLRRHRVGPHAHPAAECGAVAQAVDAGRAAAGTGRVSRHGGQPGIRHPRVHLRGTAGHRTLAARTAGRQRDAAPESDRPVRSGAIARDGTRPRGRSSPATCRRNRPTTAGRQSGPADAVRPLQGQADHGRGPSAGRLDPGQAGARHGDVADAGRRGQDHDQHRADGRPESARSARHGLPARTVPRSLFRPEGRRDGRRPRTGRSGRRHQPALQRRPARRLDREQPARGRARQPHPLEQRTRRGSGDHLLEPGNGSQRPRTARDRPAPARRRPTRGRLRHHGGVRGHGRALPRPGPRGPRAPARGDGRRLYARRTAGHGPRTPGRRRDGRPAHRGAAAEPGPDPGRQRRLRARRTVREHCPRLQFTGGDAGRAQACPRSS